MPSDESKADDPTIECWCGVTGKYSELFETVGGCCVGSGLLNCYCGGDFCVCHNHGEAECPGCPECEDAGEYDE